MKFTKGQGYWLGKHHSIESNLKRSQTMKCKPNSGQFKKKHLPHNKGVIGYKQTGQFQKGHIGFKANLGKHISKDNLELMRHNGFGFKKGNWFKHQDNCICARCNLDKLKQIRLKQVFPLRDTSIEVALQNKLRELNISFLTHKLILDFTKPDIFIEPNICIFADGCYWHACEQCYDKNKMSNWIRARQVADILITQKLINAGYKVFRFWEHDIKKNVDACISQVILECDKLKC